MVRFGFSGYEIEFPNWSKHHKTLSKHVKRVYENGEVVNSDNKQLKAIVEQNEENLKSKSVIVFCKRTDERRLAVDYYLPLINLDYEETKIDYYSVGAMNTSQNTYIRIKFLIEEYLFIVDDQFVSNGPYASTFKDYVESIGFYLDEIVEKNLPLEEVGITKGKKEDYLIVAADNKFKPVDFEISRKELIKSLIGVEVYKFKQEIKE